VATKKVAKKAAKKAPAKKAAKKAPAKKAAKKVAKKAAKKAAVKKVAKKAPVKKVAKKAAVKRTAPAVAVTSAVVAPKSVEVKSAAPASGASSAKKQGGSNRVVLAVVVGILAIGAIAISNSSNSSNEPAPTESATPTAEATPTESASTAVTNVAAPLGIVAHYTADGATIFWNATTATDGLKGYSVEVASNGGEFTELAMVGTDVTKYDITKSDDTGWMSFKISAVYTDGQKAEGKVFGLPGQYK
jgi:hypothetical protein